MELIELPTKRLDKNIVRIQDLVPDTRYIIQLLIPRPDLVAHLSYSHWVSWRENPVNKTFNNWLVIDEAIGTFNKRFTWENLMQMGIEPEELNDVNGFPRKMDDVYASFNNVTPLQGSSFRGSEILSMPYYFERCFRFYKTHATDIAAELPLSDAVAVTSSQPLQQLQRATSFDEIFTPVVAESWPVESAEGGTKRKRRKGKRKTKRKNKTKKNVLN